MPNEERIWAVLFTSAGLSELGHELQHYLREGPLGSYLFCKEVDMSQPYFRVVVSYHTTDGASYDTELYVPHIGKYLSRLRQLHHVIAPQEGFETQLRASRLPIPFGMGALGMTREIRHRRLQRVIEPCHVRGLQGLDNPA